jgi:hypothetical protein
LAMMMMMMMMMVMGKSIALMSLGLVVDRFP